MKTQANYMDSRTDEERERDRLNKGTLTFTQPTEDVTEYVILKDHMNESGVIDFTFSRDKTYHVYYENKETNQDWDFVSKWLIIGGVPWNSKYGKPERRVHRVFQREQNRIRRKTLP